MSLKTQVGPPKYNNKEKHELVAASDDGNIGGLIPLRGKEPQLPPGGGTVSQTMRCVLLFNAASFKFYTRLPNPTLIEISTQTCRLV